MSSQSVGIKESTDARSIKLRPLYTQNFFAILWIRIQNLHRGALYLVWGYCGQNMLPFEKLAYKNRSSFFSSLHFTFNLNLSRSYLQMVTNLFVSTKYKIWIIRKTRRNSRVVRIPKLFMGNDLIELWISCHIVYYLVKNRISFVIYKKH